MASRRVALPLVPALLLGLAGCSSDSELNSASNAFNFRMEDAAGYAACRNLGLAEVVDDQERREQLMLSAAASAAAAVYASIRQAVEPPVQERRRERIGSTSIGEYTADPEQLRAGCEEAGFRFDIIDEQDLSTVS